MDNYYTQLIEHKPNFILTSNSYERLCVYQALEKYAITRGNIWCQKKRIWKSEISNKFMCSKHRCELLYVDDYEGDYGCEKCGNCWIEKYDDYHEFIHWYGDHCRHVVYPGDTFPPSKVIEGLNIFYEKPHKIKVREFKNVENQNV